MRRSLSTLILALSFSLGACGHADTGDSYPASSAPAQPFGSGSSALPAAPAVGSAGATGNDAGPTDPAYLLAPGDSVTVNVYDEPDMSASQRLDVDGHLRLPLIGDVKVGGKSVREAEDQLEKLYTDRQLLKNPLVSIAVSNYALREVSVLGAVRSPGNFQFPKETTSMDIVDLITRVGGFLPTAKSDAVNVVRKTADGKERVTTVDVERMITKRRQGDAERRDFPIYPGDRIWIPERLF
ncbi:polysaccharide export protein [Horticoccus luteus]|uniref:Polysaccharide export protein n=1 Tax=Horticoccus luteus TaxID=2862869 RepID=A0A8F9TW59_9BACT|nr:polysaccharide biosynthesis/export family protein [Horticoccus luteus]QYM80354.1 polysaccharide export protein [Horticoccus luteus]